MLNICVINVNTNGIIVLKSSQLQRPFVNYTPGHYPHHTLPASMSFWKTSVINLTRLVCKYEWVIAGFVSSRLVDLHELELFMNRRPEWRGAIPVTLE